MPGWTAKGMYRLLGVMVRAQTLPTNFYIALCTDATVPSVTTNVFSDLTEIAAGNGYTAGGTQLAMNATDWDTWTEDDSNGRAFVQLKDIVWTAAGGSIPGSGDPARYAILTDDNGTQADREVWHWWDLGVDHTITVGKSLSLFDTEIGFNEC